LPNLAARTLSQREGKMEGYGDRKQAFYKQASLRNLIARRLTRKVVKEDTESPFII
jgi:hypothetical protein